MITPQLNSRQGVAFFSTRRLRDERRHEDPNENSRSHRLGILDTKTAQDLQKFRIVYSDLNWTFWHQLKRFFAHYTRDADAPIRWDGEDCISGCHRCYIPRQTALVVSSTLSEGHLHRTFPDEEIEVMRTEPTAWVAGNQVFQIRTGTYPRETILDYDSTWDVIGTSKTGQHFLPRYPCGN